MRVGSRAFLIAEQFSQAGIVRLHREFPFLAKASCQNKKTEKSDVRREQQFGMNFSFSPADESLRTSQAERDTTTPRWSSPDAAHEVRHCNAFVTSDFCDQFPCYVKVDTSAGCFGIEKLGRNLVVPVQIIHWRGEKLQMGESTEHSKRFRALVSEIRGNREFSATD